ncbi:MAG: hypothetical protein V7609_2741 [Verrucomicrobiota bacterium]
MKTAGDSNRRIRSRVKIAVSLVLDPAVTSGAPVLISGTGAGKGFAPVRTCGPGRGSPLGLSGPSGLGAGSFPGGFRMSRINRGNGIAPSRTSRLGPGNGARRSPDVRSATTAPVCRSWDVVAGARERSSEFSIASPRTLTGSFRRSIIVPGAHRTFVRSPDPSEGTRRRSCATCRLLPAAADWEHAGCPVVSGARPIALAFADVTNKSANSFELLRRSVVMRVRKPPANPQQSRKGFPLCQIAERSMLSKRQNSSSKSTSPAPPLT